MGGNSVKFMLARVILGVEQYRPDTILAVLFTFKGNLKIVCNKLKIEVNDHVV